MESERLAPGARSKRSTAQFFFFQRETKKVIAKVDEIDPEQSDRASYYSALALKGQALLDLQQIEEAGRVIDSIIGMAMKDAQSLPYGDEMNLMDRAIILKSLKPKCCELLNLVVPKIGDQEYQKRGKLLLNSACASLSDDV